MTPAEAIAEYTRGVIRARLDYARCPTRSCIVTDCDVLAADGHMCKPHHAINDGALARMRAIRAKRRAEKGSA